MFVVVLVVATHHSGSDGSDYSTDTQVPDRLSTEDTCVSEIAAWVSYTTGGGSIVDAIAEYGQGSPEWGAVQNGWRVYKLNLYQVGRDRASELATESIQRSCAAMGSSFNAGHPPPG